MRLALINPPQPYLVDHHVQTPLGILYLAAQLKNAGVDVQVVDLSAESVEEAISGISEFDVFGYTATSLDYPACVELKRGLRKRFPNSLQIIGGPHPTAVPADVWRDGFDSVFVGEAELSILSFVQDCCSLQSRPFYAQCMWTPVSLVSWPDRDALDWTGGSVLASGNEKSASILASRGCPFNCSFCASKIMWGQRVRWRSVMDVVKEMEHCVERYGIGVFRFADDNMTGNREWTLRFCEAVRSLDVTWQVNIRVDSVDPILLKTMRAAGCAEMGFGVESFDQSVLTALNKGITPEQVIRAVQMAHDAGIDSWLLLMMSTPGERYGSTPDCWAACVDCLRGKFKRLSAKVLIPLPGTPLWQEPAKFGVRIISRDLRRYNAYIYQNNEDGEAELALWSPLEIDGMTRDEQMVNLRAMVSIVEQFERSGHSES